DPTALHPEIQRQIAGIRTDLDRFSDLEVSGLVRHGYSVARKACRAHPEVFGDGFPNGPPWDPVPAAQGAAPPVAVAVRTGGGRPAGGAAAPAGAAPPPRVAPPPPGPPGPAASGRSCWTAGTGCRTSTCPSSSRSSSCCRTSRSSTINAPTARTF